MSCFRPTTIFSAIVHINLWKVRVEYVQCLTKYNVCKSGKLCKLLFVIVSAISVCNRFVHCTIKTISLFHISPQITYAIIIVVYQDLSQFLVSYFLKSRELIKKVNFS